MSDNTQLNPGTTGDLVRNIDRLGVGVKTSVVQLDFGGNNTQSERLATAADPLPVGKPFGTRSDTFTAAGNGTAINVSGRPCREFSLQVKGTGAAPTAWSIVLEGSLNGTQYTTILTHSNANPDGNNADGATTWTVAAPFLYFRSRCVSVTLGPATNLIATIVGMQ